MVWDVNSVDDTVGKKYPRIGVRHVQGFLFFWGLVVSYFFRVNLSAAIVPMTETQANGKPPDFDWSPSAKSLVLSSFFWGYVVAQLPQGLLAKHFGPKIVLGCSTLIAGVITCLHPVITAVGNWQALCALRVIIGVTQAAVYPSMHTLLAKWVPCTERAFLATAVYSGAQFGTVVLLATSGLIFDSMGWPGIFYISGGIAIVWSLLLLYFGVNEPAKSRIISKLERDYIESLTGSSNVDHELPVPWKAIFTSVPFIGLFFAHCGFTWGFFTLLTEMPSYLSEVLHLNIKSDALLSALPYFAMWILCLVLSPISDYLINHHVLSVTTSRKLFNSISQWVPMACMIGLAYMTEEQTTLAIVFLTIGVGLNAASFCGYLVNHMDLSPNFAGVMMGITNGFSNILSIFAPLVVGAIVTDETNPSQWRIIFFITAGVYLVCNTIFVIFGSGTVQPWNEPASSLSTITLPNHMECEKVVPKSDLDHDNV